MSMRDAVKIETALPGTISAVNYAKKCVMTCNPMGASIPVSPWDERCKRRL